MGLKTKARNLLSGIRRRQQKRRAKAAVEDAARSAEEVERGKSRSFQRPRTRSAAAKAATISFRDPSGKETMAHEVTVLQPIQDAVNHRTIPKSAMNSMSAVSIAEDESVDEEDEEEDYSSEEEDHEEDAEDIDDSVMEDMRKLEESFKGISQKYRLINRIGEGTFSTVYKAEQLPPFDDTVTAVDDTFESIDPDEDAPPSKRRKLSSSSQAMAPQPKRKPQYVALKKIYVTSSPHRILNELELLHALRDSPHICPLLTAFRHHDQVVAVLPYFRHLDFRLYYRDFMVHDMRHYFKSLFSALHSVHRAGILHRDIKPTNFLYDHTKQRGVLVDFGLAEKQGTDWQPCLCLENRDKRRDRYMNSFAVQNLQSQPDCVSTGFPKVDTRPSRRANRAGTRGFRAPEVLLKCTSQTTKIDIWSAGVIMLTLLARRFPFFNSADDVDAMIEMSSIFGKRRMKAVAAMHGSIFETSIDTIGERGFTLEKIIMWASCRDKDQGLLRAGESQAIKFLEGLLELDPGKRWSAKEALNHEFFTAPVEDEVERAEREQQEEAADAAEEELRR